MSEGKPERPDRTDWHRLWGLMMSPLFERLGCETSVEVEFSSKSQRLDMAVVRKDDRELRYDGVSPDYYEGFGNLGEHNLITFKSFNEVLNMTALEDLYGHCISYRKLRNIGEGDKHRIRLYAVTYHSPDALLSRFRGMPFLRCVREGRIYDLEVLTPVRIVITRGYDHPVIGMFSGDPEQIRASRHRLEQDGWLLREVSPYLGRLYEFYGLEGIDMPYTQEMFIRDHYPEWHEKIQAAKAEGISEGRAEGISEGRAEGISEGRLIGEILLAQRILRRQTWTEEELRKKTLGELRDIFSDLEARLTF